MTARKYFVGDVFETNGGSKASIISLETNRKQYVRIKWLDEFGYEMEVSTCNMARGRILNPYERTVYGVGYLGTGFDKTGGRKVTIEYARWYSMFNRSYSDTYQLSKPTYAECFVNENWHCFDDFINWSVDAVGWNNKDWQMDKDLLTKGNKEYGPDNCVLLPRKLNMLIVNRVGGRGELPIGVQWDKERSKYKGQYKEFDGKNKSKRFENPDDAFIYYKTNKERVVKEAAELYKDQIDPRAYDALMSWEISVSD